MPTVKALVTNIQWDVDAPADLNHLPVHMELNISVDSLSLNPDIDEIEEAVGEEVSDRITNKTGFCHKGYDVTFTVSDPS